MHSVWWKSTAATQHFRNCHNLEQQISYRISSQMKMYWLINLCTLCLELTLISMIIVYEIEGSEFVYFLYDLIIGVLN